MFVEPYGRTLYRYLHLQFLNNRDCEREANIHENKFPPPPRLLGLPGLLGLPEDGGTRLLGIPP